MFLDLPLMVVMRSNKMMRRIRSTFLFCSVILLGLISLSCKSKFEPLGIQLGHMDVEVRKLSNGLKVILVEDHLVPIVSYQTWYRVGSVDEKPGTTGISHLFEHLMFKGTPKYGAKQFFEHLEAKGAEVNAFTTRDYTVYYQNFIPELLNKVIDMESDRMVNLSLTDELLMTERKVVLEERRLRTENSPGGKVEEALWQLAYREHPYSWPVIGYPEDLMAMTLPQIVAYYQNHYQPSNAAVVVVGDFDSEQVFKEIKNHYGKIPSRSKPKREIPTEPEQKEERRLVLRDTVNSERLAQAYHVSSATEEDSYALDVLANILFGGTSSRGYRLLVEEKDIALGLSGVAYTPTYPGLFLINVMMKQGVASAQAERFLSQIVEEVQMSGVTQEEIKVAVRQLTVQLVDSIRTPYGLGILMGTVETVFGDPLRYAEDVEKYLKVTDVDVRRVARKYLNPNNRSVVILAPKDTQSMVSRTGGRQ